MTTVSEFDSNGDGEISFDEFVLMMKKIGIWIK
jgi:Ca2+-binding EF-hand superfamily protein